MNLAGIINEKGRSKKQVNEQTNYKRIKNIFSLIN